MDIEEMIIEIKDAIIMNKLVVFVGAGVSKNSSFPTWQELVSEMNNIINYRDLGIEKTFSNEDLLKIPQFLKLQDKSKYREIIINNFDKKAEEINPIIDIALEFQPHHIITTNFDCLIENAIESKRNNYLCKGSVKKYTTICCDGDLVNADTTNMLIKMHGDVNNIENIVLCEDDYLDYSNSHILIETYIKSLLVNHIFLFIGYGVGDYNLKLIMNWVERVLQRHKNASSICQKNHFLLFSDSNSISDFDRNYLKSKRINVLDTLDIAISHKKDGDCRLSDERGERIYRTLEYIKKYNVEQKYSIEFIAKQLRIFEQFNIVNYTDILKILGDTSFFYRKIEETLVVETPNDKQISAMSLVCQVCVDEAHNCDEVYIQEVFLKAGIFKIFDMTKKKLFKINREINEKYQYMYKAIITNDLAQLDKYITDTQYNKIDQAFLCLYLGRIDEYNKRMRLIKLDSPYIAFRSSLNSLQHYCNQEIMPANILDKLGEKERYAFYTFEQFFLGNESLLAEISEQIVKLKKKYTPYNEGKVIEFSYIVNEGFMQVRTKIYDTIRFLFINGIYTDGFCNGKTRMPNYDTLFENYIDLILYFKSTMCKQDKYETPSLCIEDIFIVTNILENDSMKLSFERYMLDNIELDENCQTYIVKSLKNISNSIIINRDNNDLYIQLFSIGYKILFLLNRCVISEHGQKECILCLTDVILNIQDINNEHYMLNAREFLDLALSIIRSYCEQFEDMVIEEKLNEIVKQGLQLMKNEKEILKSLYYKYIIEMQLLLYRLDICCRNNKSMQSKDIYYIVNRFIKEIVLSQKGYSTLVQIFPYCTKELQEKIKLFFNENLNNMSNIDILNIVAQDIVSYSAVIEKILLERCREKGKIEDYFNFNIKNTPLECVLRLKEQGKISNINIFAEFLGDNLFFDYVCFPDKFDYNKFDVERLYSWLQIEPYRSIAKENASVILGQKFKDAIQLGTREEVRAIYYQHFYVENSIK